MLKQGHSLAKRRQKEEKAMKTRMIKSSFKALVLVVVLVGSLASAGIMQAPAPAGPIPLCPPSHPNCDEATYNVAFVAISQAPPPAGPIPLCPPDHPNCDESNATYGVAYAAISLALAHTSLYGF